MSAFSLASVDGSFLGKSYSHFREMFAEFGGICGESGGDWQREGLKDATSHKKRYFTLKSMYFSLNLFHNHLLQISCDSIDLGGHSISHSVIFGCAISGRSRGDMFW